MTSKFDYNARKCLKSLNTSIECLSVEHVSLLDDAASLFSGHRKPRKPMGAASFFTANFISCKGASSLHQIKKDWIVIELAGDISNNHESRYVWSRDCYTFGRPN